MYMCLKKCRHCPPSFAYEASLWAFTMQSALVTTRQPQMKQNMTGDSPLYHCHSGGIPSINTTSPYCVVQGGYVVIFYSSSMDQPIDIRSQQCATNVNMLRPSEQQRLVASGISTRLLSVVQCRPSRERGRSTVHSHTSVLLLSQGGWP